MHNSIKVKCLLTSLGMLLLFSCASQTNNAFRKTLIEKRIGTTNYFISIPKDYSVTQSDGIDFTVYYFSPIDTTIKAKFSGGLYLGNYPGEFEMENDSCKIENLKSKILDSLVDWKAYICNGIYSVQTITESKSGEDWNRLMHAFGTGVSRDEMNKILAIYSTLRHKRK